MAENIRIGGMNVSTATSTGEPPDGAEPEYYTWTTLQHQIVVQNLSGSSITMKVLFHGTAAGTAVSATVYDVNLDAGDSVIWSHPIKEIGIYFSAAAILGTNYQIRGWE